MSTDKDMPAFPMATIDGYTQDGMQLRDYFAAHALNGAVSRYVQDDSNPGTWEQQLAADCYTIADAMLEARHLP